MNNISWSLGSRPKQARLSPNKSVEPFEPSIPTHPSDPTALALSAFHRRDIRANPCLQGQKPAEPIGITQSRHLRIRIHSRNPWFSPWNHHQTRDYRGPNRSDRSFNFAHRTRPLPSFPENGHTSPLPYSVIRTLVEAWKLRHCVIPSLHRHLSTQPVEITRFNPQTPVLLRSTPSRLLPSFDTSLLHSFAPSQSVEITRFNIHPLISDHQLLRLPPRNPSEPWLPPSPPHQTRDYRAPNRFDRCLNFTSQLQPAALGHSLLPSLAGHCLIAALRHSHRSPPHHPPSASQKTSPLTLPFRYINLSASVDGNGLIESGGGTGPSKPRQPTQGASLSDQVPNPAQVQPGTNEKTRTSFRPLLTSMGRGLFVAPGERSPRRRAGVLI
jgi:hypothetical protein